jgi:hypothetical protein
MEDDPYLPGAASANNRWPDRRDLIARRVPCAVDPLVREQIQASVKAGRDK